MTEPSTPDDLTCEISAELAEELYESSDGDTVNGWTRIVEQEGDDGRWHRRMTLVLQGEFGSLWGVDFKVGLTENQEPSFPWEANWKNVKPEVVTARRLQAVPVTIVKYQYVK